uniref:Uncharacterized protein LOC111102382 isoform X1 n=1 Tax=Crassostrea virginica TaxID=6565 RepID=A0A8B8AHM2_CRAVI|nr:uncharacterized protein LOC111102382 isoform X1 [Crassostrea virginica]
MLQWRVFLHVDKAIMFFSILGFSSVFLQCVSNENGKCEGPSKCCQGYKWDEEVNKCTECQYPQYGRDCSLSCNCSETKCNTLTGCAPYNPTADTATLFLTSKPDTIEKSESTVNTPRGQYLRSTLLAIPSTSQDLIVSTLSNVHIQKNNNGTSIVLVSSTEMDVHSERKALNVLLLRFIYSLSPITGVLLVLYVSLKVNDFTKKRRALRLPATKHTTENHYDEIELTTITNSGFP